MQARSQRLASSRLILFWCFALVLGVVSLARAQAPDTLSLERIFSSAEFYGSGGGGGRWLADGGYVTMERSEVVRGGVDLVRHDPSTDAREVLVPASALIPAGADRPLRLQNYSWSADGKQLLVFTSGARVWRFASRGDYWVLDLATRKLRKLGGDAPPSTLMFAKFSPDGARVAYVRQNNIYVEDLGGGGITQLTHDGSRTIINGTFDWVYEEELGMRDGFRWSPDGKWIAYWQLDAAGVRDFLMINNTDSLYSYTIPVQYPKAGTTNSAARVGVVSATGGPTVWMKVEGDPRNNYIARMQWSDNADEVVIQQLNRPQNRLQLMLGNAATGDVRTILTEADSAWVDLWDNGQLWADRQDHVEWLDGGKRFLWVTDRDGWRRVYAVSRDGRTMKPITPRETDVMATPLIDTKGGWVYYMASPEVPTQRYLYRVPLDGSMKAQRLSPTGEPGTHEYSLSPDGRYAFHGYSTFNAPPVSALVELPSHRVVRGISDNAELKQKLSTYRHHPGELFRVDIGDGVILDGWMIKPNDFDPAKRYPVLFEVYGEPAGTTVNDSWGGAQTFWYQYLADKGYLIMSLDNRGTPAPRGRAWRKSVYKKIGVLTSQDQANGLRAIIAKYPFVDGSRIGVWGWSGGGSSTLNLLFRYPDLYHTGMAVASVPDLRYYDTIYQERYMGLPQDDPDAYARCSPISYADRLRGNLLLVHGTGDDNVHYQGAEALINKLVEHGKHFTMMAYPNRSHGIYEGPGTTMHLYRLLTGYLLEHLPAGGR